MHGARNLQQLCMVQVPYNSFVYCRYLTTVMYDAGTLQLCIMQVTYNSYARCRQLTTVLYDAGNLRKLCMTQLT